MLNINPVCKSPYLSNKSLSFGTMKISADPSNINQTELLEDRYNLLKGIREAHLDLIKESSGQAVKEVEPVQVSEIEDNSLYVSYTAFGEKNNYTNLIKEGLSKEALMAKKLIEIGLTVEEEVETPPEWLKENAETSTSVKIEWLN